MKKRGRAEGFSLFEWGVATVRADPVEAQSIPYRSAPNPLTLPGPTPPIKQRDSGWSAEILYFYRIALQADPLAFGNMLVLERRQTYPEPSSFAHLN